jgi:hypothetical protein
MSKNGQLLAAYYRFLVKNPVSLVPYNPKALNQLATIVGDSSNPPSASGLYAATGLAGPQSSQGWATVQPGPFQFPQEHGPHWGIRNEWYYLACNLTYTLGDTPPQNMFLLLAIIRRGTVPQSFGQGATSNQLQIVACEATIEIPGSGTPYISVATAFDGMDPNASIQLQAPSGSQPFIWSAFGQSGQQGQLFGLSSTQNSDMFPMNCGITFMNGSLPVQVQLSLQAPSTPQFFLQGQQGCAPCIDGLGYRYYSWPALTVSGTVQVGAVKYACKGQGWLDHQWGSRMQPLGYVDNLYLRALSILSGSYPKTLAPQWDWFFVHLSNGWHITTAVLPSQGFHNGTGPVPLTNTTVIVVGSDGTLTYQTFSKGTVTYSDWVTVNCNLYASKWVLSWTKGPHVINLTLNVTQLPPAGFGQGVDGQTFMEKGVTVTGTVDGDPVTGTGFAEAIGYDSIDRQLINMLTQLVPASDIPGLLPLFYPASATTGQIALASLIVIVPPVVLLIIIITVIAVVLRKKAKRKKMLLQ